MSVRKLNKYLVYNFSKQSNSNNRNRRPKQRSSMFLNIQRAQIIVARDRKFTNCDSNVFLSVTFYEM